MTINRTRWLSLLVLSLVAVPVAPAAGQAIEGRYICVFKSGAVAKGQVATEATRAARAQGGAVTQSYSNSIRGFALTIPAPALAAMAARNPKIAYCERDQVISAIPVRAEARAGGGNVRQQVPWGVTYVGGGIAGATGRAWVIDSGIDGAHPDLNVNTALSRNFSSGSSWTDGNGHGSHVAGIIGARNNTVGVVGVAPGVELVAVRVLNNTGSGTVSGVIAGVDYVAGAAGGKGVANMSLGGGVSTALDQAVLAAAATGVRFVLAAGNDSNDVSGHSPARVNGPNVFTVSAFGQGSNGTALWATFSNFGNGIDFAEPGVSIVSTYKGGGYATMSGTSMAAPHLAGLLLLGAVRNGGIVTGDPDGTYEPIGVR